MLIPALEQYAYLTLRGAIIRCELAPGEKLIIDRLSAEMGLSQIPIRAAKCCTPIVFYIPPRKS